MPNFKENIMNFDTDLFVNYWHLICHKNELLNDGDYLRFDTPIGDVVLFNDMGNVIAFDNRCPHRGTHFFKNDFGNQLASCPYHRWAYRNSKIIVPDKHRFVDCNIENADLNKYQVEMCGDFIFLGITPRFGVRQQLGDFAETLEKISLSIQNRLDFNRYAFECYWAIAIENSIEPYHVPVVHSQTLGNLKFDPEQCETVFAETNSVIYAPIGNVKLEKQLKSFHKFFDINFKYDGYFSFHIFPFTIFSSTFGYSYSLQNFFPSQDGANSTKFTSRFYSSKLSNEKYAPVLDSFFESAAALNRKVFEEDHEICKETPRDTWSTQPLQYASQIEQQIVHFRKMCK